MIPLRITVLTSLSFDLISFPLPLSRRRWRLGFYLKTAGDRGIPATGELELGLGSLQTLSPPPFVAVSGL